MKKKVLYGVTLALLGGASMVSLQSCKDDLSDLQEQVDFQKGNNFASLKELWDYCRDNGDKSLNGRLKALESFLDAIMKDYPTDEEEGIDGGKNFAEAFKKAYNTLFGDPEAEDPLEKKGLLEAFKEQQITVQDLEERVAVLESQVEATIDRLDNLITGIIIQRAFGDVFGDFSLPIGVQSNMLFNWYGKNVNEIPKFPYKDQTDEVAANLDFDFAPFAESTDDYYSKIDLGTIYLTINPVGHNFNDQKLTLETSDGVALDAEVFGLDLNKSTDKLMFGATRSTITDNGFYKANLVVPNKDENVTAIKVNLDEAKLKSAVKNVAKDPSVSSAAQLVKAVYDQLKNQVPAYAVRYDWESPTTNFTASRDEDGNVIVSPTKTAEQDNREMKPYSVLSKYELAVATARPLSYNSLKGVSSDKQLPTGHLVNFFNKLRDKALEKINVEAIASVADHKVAVESISFENAPENGGIVAVVKGLTVDGKLVQRTPALSRFEAAEEAYGEWSAEGEIKVNCGIDPNMAVDRVTSGIAKAVCIVLNDADNEALLAEAQLSLNAVLLEMNNKINQIVADIKGSVKSGFESVEHSNYFDRVNKVFDLYDKIANKLNGFLANPNAALQVNALYDANDDFGLLSQSSTDPTPFEGNGNAIKIYLTSNTGEFLAPAYKKFFACTDGVDCVVVKDAYKDGKVLKGTTPYVEIDATKLEKNKTYGFVYQGLDYSGYTSTKKFYIVVK